MQPRSGKTCSPPLTRSVARRKPCSPPRRRRHRTRAADVSVTLALTVFALIFPAELPDKTFIATLVLSTRYPPVPVFVGVAAAFVVQTTVAVAAGGLLSLLPERPVHAVTAVLFGAGALLI